jgi:hypothetical protein
MTDQNSAAEPQPAVALLDDPATSTWLKSMLQWALERDPVDALNDALELAGILEERLRREFGLDELP